jgi:hypothetical protein
MLPLLSIVHAYTLAPRCAAPRMVATTTSSPTLRPDIAAELGNEPTAGMADEAALLAENAFVIPPDELIALAKAFTAAQLAGTADGSNGGADWFAPDFRFVAPVVGPFDKSEFVDSLKSFDLKTAFPSMSSNYHHWRVCPFEPNRVWYSVKYIGSNDGPVLGQPATFKKVESLPCVISQGEGVARSRLRVRVRMRVIRCRAGSPSAARDRMTSVLSTLGRSSLRCRRTLSPSTSGAEP